MMGHGMMGRWDSVFPQMSVVGMPGSDDFSVVLVIHLLYFCCLHSVEIHLIPMDPVASTLKVEQKVALTGLAGLAR